SFIVSLILYFFLLLLVLLLLFSLLLFFFQFYCDIRSLHSFPTRRSSDLDLYISGSSPTKFKSSSARCVYFLGSSFLRRGTKEMFCSIVMCGNNPISWMT